MEGELCSLAPISKEMSSKPVGVFFILFATWEVFLQIWSASLYSYSAGKANGGFSAAIAEQPAPTLLI